MLTHTDPIDYRNFLEESTKQVVTRLTEKSKAIVLNRLSSLGRTLKKFGKSQENPFRLSPLHGVASLQIEARCLTDPHEFTRGSASFVTKTLGATKVRKAIEDNRSTLAGCNTPS